MTKFSFKRHKYLYLILLTFGCYITDTTATEELQSQNKKNEENIGLVSENLNNNSNDIIVLQKKIKSLEEKISVNSEYVIGLRDSISVFQQLNISVESGDQDIINSLIRIQSKLNIIEDKIFYSDSLYFNLLNDLVLIESQIEDLSHNIENIVSLNDTIEEVENDSIINSDDDLPSNNIQDYKEAYDLAIELYKNNEYENSLNAFKDLVSFDSKNNLADNCQFWISQIYYIQREYEVAISEYKKVSVLGDGNKAADADYKIALSYLKLDNIDLAIAQFNKIIIQYPDNANLVKKSKEYIDRNK